MTDASNCIVQKTSADVKGDAYEGLLEKNAQDVKGGKYSRFSGGSAP